MGQHLLQLNFPDSPVEGVLLVDDISIYDGYINGVHVPAPGTLPIACPTLQITSPGFSTPTVFSVSSGFRSVLNACALGIMTPSGCVSSCPGIPDGLYNIRYSVSPSDSIYVEYKVLRIVQALNRYYKLLCKLQLQPNLPSTEVQYQLQQLDIIYNYLISAKATVEGEHQFTDGMNQYKFAVSLMDKMSYEPRC